VVSALVHGGHGRALSGDPERGLAQLRAGLAGWSALGTEAFTTWIRTSLAELLASDRQLEAAAVALDEVEAQLASGEEQIAALAIPYVRGLALRAAGDDDAAAASQFRPAIALAVEWEARGPQLRASTALADVWCDHERFAEARAMLETIVAWFIEGADTPDLRAAQSVLDRCTS
jgi:hypothetical protein